MRKRINYKFLTFMTFFFIYRELYNDRNSIKQHNIRHQHNSQQNINRFGFAAVPKHLDHNVNVQ